LYWPAGIRAGILAVMVAIAILCGLRQAAGTAGYGLFQLTGIVVVTAM